MKQRFNISVVFLLALAVALAGGCAERKDPHDPAANVHSADWMKPASEDFHGQKIADVGLISCAECHGEEYDGGSSHQSCFECHDGPSGHPEGYLVSSNASFHGNAVAQNGTEGCTECHGEDYRGEEHGGATCYDCHNGPSGHPDTGWLTYEHQNFHGLDAASRDLDACAACHGEDFNGGTSGQSCKTCHPSESGHPASGFVDRGTAFHGDRYDTNGENYCAACHGADLMGGYSTVTCFDCHNGPSGHPDEGFLDPAHASFHGLEASSRGLAECATCHGEDFTGGTSGKSCSECHDDQSGHPAAAKWLLSGDEDFHAERLIETSLAYCAGCHGADFTGGQAEVSCFTCHDGASGHPATGWLDKTSANFHGLDASTRGVNDCARCHGEDFTGGLSGQSCTHCHTSQSGHPATGWLDNTSASFHGDRMAATGMEYCAGCHGADYTGGDANVSCFTCHDGPSGHPATGWFDTSSENFHGLAASSRLPTDCAACHGEDFNGGISGQSCKVCHVSESGHPASGWMTTASNSFHGVRLAGFGPSYCAGCHGEDYQGGYAGVSCFVCHNGPSGHPATGWLTSSSQNFHGLDASNRGLAACAACHGEEFDGGVSGKSCGLCHEDESGHPPLTSWLDNDSSSFHGTRTTTMGAVYCAGCHGADYTGGTAEVSCFACHGQLW